MSVELKIFLSAIVACAIAFVLWLIGVLRDGRKERRRIREFQQDIARQERTLAEDHEAWKQGEPPVRIETDIAVDSHAYRKIHKDDDTTLILPGVEP